MFEHAGILIFASLSPAAGFHTDLAVAPIRLVSFAPSRAISFFLCLVYRR